MTSQPAANLRLGGASHVGEDRVRLLEAIARHGSITAAGQSVGLSYRAAWDAVQSLNNLFRTPLVRAQAGGRAGGTAVLTAEGEAALRTLRHIQAEIRLTVDRLQRKLQDEPGATLSLDAWSLVMRTSARNALHGTVTGVTDGAVNSEVTLEVSPGIELVAIISKASVESLALKAGSDVVALIKSSFVILMAGEGPFRTSARNALRGTIVRLEDGAVNTEVVLELADGKSLVAMVTHQSAKVLDLKVGDVATALIKASHVILAVE